MDEIDAIGGRRFSEGTSADREIQRTLMELLNQLDGFDQLGRVRGGEREGEGEGGTLVAVVRPGRLPRHAWGHDYGYLCHSRLPHPVPFFSSPLYTRTILLVKTIQTLVPQHWHYHSFHSPSSPAAPLFLPRDEDDHGRQPA